MEAKLVKVGDQVVNLAAIAAAHWEGEKLFVHISGGRWLTFSVEHGNALWALLVEQCKDVSIVDGELQVSK